MSIEEWETEDWETCELIIPNLIRNESENKSLEERRLQEESDNALAVELFSNNTNKQMNTSYSKIPSPPPQTPLKMIKKNIQNNNSEKQKLQSLLNREKKQKQLRASEIFGEYHYEDDADYIELEDRFLR